MARNDKKINELKESTNPIKSGDIIAMYSDGQTERQTVDSVLDYVESNITIPSPITGGTYSNGTTTLLGGSNVTIDGYFTGVTVSNTLFVDENGDDATAIKGRLDKPYRTLYAAKTGSTSGDTIYVFPQTITYDNRNATGNQWNGRTNEIDLWKNGISYYFSPGTKIQLYNETTAGDSMFLFDATNALTGDECKVLGHLEYVQYGEGADSSNGWNAFLWGTNGTSSGFTFHAELKKLETRHMEVVRIASPCVAGDVNITINTQEEIREMVAGNSGTGSFMFIRTEGTSKINFLSTCNNRNFISGAYPYYIRGSFTEDSKVVISGDKCETLSQLLLLRDTNIKHLKININDIFYENAYTPFGYTGAILSTSTSGGWVVDINANLYDTNGLTTSGLFSIGTTNNTLNYKGDIYTNNNISTGRYIVGNNGSNSVVNLEGNIYMLGTATTTNIILQAYSSGSVTNFKGKIEGNYTFLAHPRLGGVVNIDSSKITSTADDFVMLDHTDTTLSTFRMNNSYVKGKNDIDTFVDGQYLNTIINNSTIINTGSGDTLTNLTNNGTLQILNSNVYSNSGNSINYTVSGSSVISSNTTMNTPYSATTLYGDITTLTNLIY